MDDIPSSFKDKLKATATALLDGTLNLDDARAKRTLVIMSRYLVSTPAGSYSTLKRKIQDVIKDEADAPKKRTSTATGELTAREATYDQLKLQAAKLSPSRNYIKLAQFHKTLSVIQTYHADDVFGPDEQKSNRPLKLVCVDFNESPHQIYYANCFPKTTNNNFLELKQSPLPFNVNVKNFSLCNWVPKYDERPLLHPDQPDLVDEVEKNKFNMDISFSTIRTSPIPPLSCVITLSDALKLRAHDLIHATLTVLADTETLNIHKDSPYTSLYVSDDSCDTMVQLKLLSEAHEDICSAIMQHSSQNIEITIRSFQLTFEPSLAILLEETATIELQSH